MLINIITLGCSKNSVDSEVIASAYNKLGHNVVFESKNKSDIVVINTCCFIQSAKEESLEEIFIQLENKKNGKTKKVYVVGCMAERYKNELKEELLNIDGVISFAELSVLLNSPDFNLFKTSERILTTPKHYAYLKISEGCDRQCSFCAIPNIRGKQISTPIDLLCKEATLLTEQGVKELILIAQDLTNYGFDFAKSKILDKLLIKLVEIKGIEWIRLHYAFPNDFPVQILDVMKEYPNICNYMDIPFQHVSENVLRSMNRPYSPKKIYTFIDMLRDKIPNITLRTTILSGYPVETEENHKELLQFIESVKFNRLGVFSYSQEEDTPAFSLGDPVNKKIKKRRYKELMTAQKKISFNLNKAKIGTKCKVIIDSETHDCYVARSESDSPEVDNTILIKKDKILKTGEFYNATIIDAMPYDLIAVI